MPPKRFIWLERIKQVEREYSAISVTTIRLLEAAKQDANLIRRGLRLRDLEHAVLNLSGTFVIRLFAEFETGLRTYWLAARATSPATRDLLEGVAARRGIPIDDLADVHAVREYRNVLVHEREEDIEPIPLSLARSRLCKFLARLPDEW
jgi:hypothetical protein